ncbi:MAG: heparinase II/III-family protein [Armatimonadetes bacterium]|nr:heparinase II/III-family protein [Armatimonadota bacterium]
MVNACGLVSMAVLILLALSALPAGGQPGRGWGAMADDVKQRPELAPALQKIADRARPIAAKPLVKRVYRYADLGQDRTWLDGRAKFMDGQPRQEIFGLAMSDFGTSGTILSELPLLAFAYRCTGEEAFGTRIISQLEETATWSPLQRPGWQLCTPAPDPVPADYWDGSWLATGQGVRALADTLELIPEGSLSPELVGKLHDLLRAEIKTISDDWNLKRGWFRSGGGYPQTNQWVLPTEGLIRACLVLGKDQFPTEYELGVTNLIRAMDAQGQQGEFNEGIGYANFTVGSMLAAAHAMAAQGDSRALEHPFLRGFAAWSVHHLQPGRFRVNCFDAGGARTGRNDGGARGLLSTLAVFAGSPVARWALDTLYDGPSDDLIGLLARTVTVAPEAIPPFAFYDGPARRVNWRDSWADDATGVWVRGGHPLDSHDHYDRGHVNFIARGKPLLIEAGTPGYDNPTIHTLYSTVVGHNVLDVADLKPKKTVAPITVSRLDATGGDLIVEPTACYPGLQSWRRHVTWSAAGLRVADTVQGPADKPAVMTFRWHLGNDQPATITGADAAWEVVWPDGKLALTSTVPLQVTQEKLPDSSVCLGKKDNGWDYVHTCIVVRTAAPASAWELTTAVTPAQ